MPGPRLEVVHDEEWMQRLRRENIREWYGIHEALRARAFARMDSEAGPSAGDLIVTKRTIYEHARLAVRALDGGGQPDAAGLDALKLLIHEYAHCMVRLDATGQAIPLDLEIYSHPTKPWPGLLHALRRGFALNAFTGLLRWRRTPTLAWEQGQRWFRAQIALLEA